MKYRGCSLIVAVMVSGVVSANVWDDVQATVTKKDLSGLKNLICKNPSVTTTIFDSGRTILMAAAAENWVQGVECCVENGALVDQVDAEKRTALIHATSNGSIDAVRELLRLKSNINVQDAYKSTPTHYALTKFVSARKKGDPVAGKSSNALDVIHVLLSAKPNQFLQDATGTSVHAMIKYGLKSEDAALILSGIPGSKL